MTVTIDGKRRSVYGKNRAETLEKFQKLTQKKQNGATFGEIATEWWQIQIERGERGQIRKTTLKNYSPHLERIKGVYGEIPIKDITGEHIRNALVQAASAGYSRTVVNSIRVIFNGILTHACSKGLILVNPGASIPLPARLPKGKRRAPTPEEEEIVYQHHDDPFDFYVFFLLCTGLRRSEALALHKSDIDLANRSIRVIRSLVYVHDSSPIESTPKTESSVRMIPIVPPLFAPLIKYMQTLKGEYLFPRRYEDGHTEDKYQTAIYVSRQWQYYRRRYNLPEDLTLHCMRHGTATLLYEAGVDVRTTQRILGHSNSQTTTEIYQELRDAQYRKDIENLNIFLTEHTDQIAEIS